MTSLSVPLPPSVILRRLLEEWADARDAHNAVVDRYPQVLGESDEFRANLVREGEETGKAFEDSEFALLRHMGRAG